MSVIFTDRWAFVVAVVLLWVLLSGIADIVRAWRGEGKDE